VAVATSEDQRKAGSFLHIIAGFEAAAGGAFETRTAGVLAFKDVRKGLALLASEVAAKVEEISIV
jgi:NAD(P)H-hydrate repair Nnr-like enzyme with NAD(P)H-hydrate dehydratase domain